ncbi:hypothetical protein MTO96_032445, partial [Rhipicephalus appendiculatus]
MLKIRQQDHLEVFRVRPLAFGPVVCLRLYYIMKQDSGASLSVEFTDERRNFNGRPVTVEATEPSRWTLLQVERTDLPPVFTVVITGRTLDGSSDIAIDDIDIRSGKCENTQPAPKAPIPGEVARKTKTSDDQATSQPMPAVKCKRDQFKCSSDNTCIARSLLCDGVNDCRDGLDEKC